MQPNLEGRTMSIKDVRIEVRVRNNVLWHAIFDKWSSVSAFCAEKKFAGGVVGRLLNLKMSPFHKKTGDYIGLCKRLAKELGRSPVELFPLELYKLPQKEMVIEASLARLQNSERALNRLPAPTSPYEVVVARELSAQVDQALQTLTPREELVVRLRTGLAGDGKEWTLQEIGHKFFVGRGRIEQIESKAIEKLRRPRAAKRLEEFNGPS